MVTVAEILKLPSLSGCSVLSGLSGQDRSVVGWSCATDFGSSPCHREGELVMFPAPLVASGSEKKASAWLETLIDAKVAALGIQVPEPTSRLPPHILAIGDRNRFPIFGMPTDLSLPRVREEVFELILARKAASLRKALDTLSLLTSSAIEGRIPGFVEQIGEVFDNPVLFETCNLNYVASSTATDSSAAKILALRRNADCVRELHTRLKSGKGFEYEPIWRLKFLRQDIQVDGTVYEQLTFPVENGDPLFGYLSLIQVNKSFDYGDSLMMLATLDATCLLAQFDVTYEVHEEVKQELLRLIITPELSHEAMYKAKLFGFDYVSPLFCAIVRPMLETPAGQGWLFHNSILDSVTTELKRIDAKVFCVAYHSSLVVFCHIAGPISETDPASKKSAYRIALGSIQKAVGRLKDVPIMRIGAGRPGIGIQAARLSYEEAASALSIAERFDIPHAPGAEPVIFSDIRYFQIIDSLLQDEGKARLFCLDILGRFTEQNLKSEEEYLRTLEAYLYYGRNLSEIQRNVGIHRNTVKYRIDKIQEVLDVDLNDIQVSVSIWVALQLRKILLLKNNMMQLLDEP